MYLSIVIPAYNEHDRIVDTLIHTRAYLDGQEYNSEILVVSDGSADDTCEVVRSFGSTGRVILRALEYHPNQGKGYAVRYGMLRAAGDRILFMDADYAVPVPEIEKGLILLDSGYDIAIGSRAVAGARVEEHQNFVRELSARIYTCIQTLYLGIRYPDTQCGFKLFTRTAARRLFRLQRLNSVIFDPEILWLAGRHGFSVAEFPVHWRHVGNSRIQYDSLKKSLFVFQELFRIRRLHRE
jgi:glycosyltransferase involved in cell wall biosynthesis